MPPADLDAEMGVLGSVILDPRRLDDAAEVVQAQDFYSDANGAIWKRLVAMDAAGQAIDPVLLSKSLKASGEHKTAGGDEHLAEVLNSVAVAAHAVYYAKIVAKKAKYRRLIAAAYDMLRDAYAEAGDPDAILDEAEKHLTAIGTDAGDAKPVLMRDAVLEAIAAIEAASQRKNQTGVMTGFDVFDRNMGGLFRGELFILAARPGVGKTSMACQIAYHCGVKNRPVLFVSLEMSAAELATRILASLAGVSSKRIRTSQVQPEDYGRLTAAAGPLAEALIHVHGQAGASVFDIRRWARRMARKGLSLIVIDYLQRLKPEDSRAKRYEQVGQMTRSLKSLAVELQVPILCLAQAGREADNDSTPKLSHLRESGDIEADADVVAFIGVKPPQPGDTEETEREAVLDIAKNRNGEIGQVKMRWIPYRTMFVCEGEPQRHEEFNEFAR